MYYLICENDVTPIDDYRILVDVELTIIVSHNAILPIFPNKVDNNGKLLRKIDYVKDMIIYDANFNDGVVFYNVHESVFDMKLEFGNVNKIVSYQFDHFNYGHKDDTIFNLIRQLKINKLIDNIKK